MDTFIKNLKIVKFEKSNFIKSFRILFEMDGKERYWDCIKVHDSVCVLLYNVDRDAFLLVKQFRPAVWYRQQQKRDKISNSDAGYTYELCAGILDKNLSEEKTAIEEIYEETGYDVKSLEYITSFYSSLGFAASKQSIFYATIQDKDIVSNGGGIDGENIELVYVYLKDAMSFIYNEDNIKASSLLFSFMWFFKYKCDKNGKFINS